MLRNKEMREAYNKSLEGVARNFRLAFCDFIGEFLFSLKIKPMYSHGICGRMTCGYGEACSNGYFKYPVPSEERRLRLEEQKEQEEELGVARQKALEKGASD